jgi:hypothetical protein
VVSVLGGYTDNALVRYSGTSGNNIKNSSASISDSGVITAAGFSGAGSSLTALNASQLTSGTVPDARFPATLPASSGVNLTALNATQLTSGTVPVTRLGTAGTRDATTFLRGDNTWATVSGGGTASDSFATIAVAGQSSVVADSATDTLTLVAGSNITITTDASTDTVTIAAAGGGTASNSFATLSVAGQSNVVADSATDTLTLVAGSGIAITTDADSDTVTVTSTVSSGATAFTGLSDRADLTVDQFYLSAITRLNVTNNGASSYRFDQYGSADNPTLYALNGATIAFNLNVSGHPFLIQTSGGSNYNEGLTHVTTTGVVTTGSSAQGKVSGTLYWKIPSTISGNYRYICSIHGSMVGVISISNVPALGTVPNANTQVSSLGVGTAASGTTGEIRATNNITAFYSSDSRLKENVRDIPNALDKVSAIGGKLFDWNDEYIASHGGLDDYFLTKESFGVIAQDVKEVFPEAVRTREDGYLAVDYERMCALAFQAIKELQHQVLLLEQQIKDK